MPCTLMCMSGQELCCFNWYFTKTCMVFIFFAPRSFFFVLGANYGKDKSKWLFLRYFLSFSFFLCPGQILGSTSLQACFSCAQRSKLGSNTAAAAPSSVDSGSSTAMPQADAIKKNSAADPTNRAQRPRKQPARASARHRRAHSLDAMPRSGVFAARTRTYERNPVQGRRR